MPGPATFHLNRVPTSSGERAGRPGPAWERPPAGMLLLLAVFCLLAGAAGAAAPNRVLPPARVTARLPDDALLDLIQRRAFAYFVEAVNPDNGLVLDRADNRRPVALDYCPATIAGTGFGLAAWCVGAERGWMPRRAARDLVVRTFRFFLERMFQKRGFFYHFVDARTGARVWNCEISSIDTALLLAGVVTARSCFADDPELVGLADRLLDRVDWAWMTAGGIFPRMGWKPESGFLESAWDHYCESHLLYILAMGATRHAISDAGWRAMRRPWGEYGGQVFIGCPPLFTHQFSHLFVDFRNRADADADYFENSRRATLANRQFCLDLRRAFRTFDEERWGLTACIGPSGYRAYGAPPGVAIVDGTVAPAAAGCAITVAPDLAVRSLRHLYERFGDRLWGRFGFADSFNLDAGFVATDAYAINQGPLLLAIENHRTGRVWRWFMADSRVQRGLQRAGLVEGRRPPPPDPAAVVRTNPFLPWERPAFRSTPVAGAVAVRLGGAEAPAWRDLPAITLDARHLQQGYNPRPAFRTTIQVAHTPSLVLVRFEVHDLHPVNGFSTDAMARGDSLEFFLDTHGDGMKWGGADDLLVSVAPGQKGTGLRWREVFHPASTTPHLRVSGATDATGYRGVLVLRRGPLGLTGPGAGFSAVVHDIDGQPKPGAPGNRNLTWGRDVRYSWYFAEPGPVIGTLLLDDPSGGRSDLR